MTRRVEGKVACVTGAASGIGRATALLLAREGAMVVATDVQRDKGASLIEEMAGWGEPGLFLHHDVADEEGWRVVVEEIDARYGRLDILVNNAGIAYPGAITDLSLDLWRRQMAINVDGTFLGIKHGLPLMRRGGGGSIVNVSSIAGLKPAANTSCYAASKAAVRALTKSVALECAALRDGVRVNSIHPGIVETAIWDTLLGRDPGANAQSRAAAMDSAVGASIPMGHVGTPQDIAEGILWLASAQSAYVTGTELVIDGGRSIA